MAQVNEILIGTVPSLGLPLYRRFITFVPKIFINNGTVSLESYIEVQYEEYCKDLSGNIYNESHKKKYYVVANIPAVLDENGNEITPVWNAFDNWFNDLDRTPINPNTNGILDSVEYTLLNLPIGVPNGYTLQSS